ncbi:MAG TPA: VWA domain-containing protein [Thermoanaerobaculia bacterium]|nr:VWA domain-containing protein [Thermoanaerobaculia bacterium]
MGALLLLGLVAAPAPAARVEIVLDASGSMRAAVGGTSKMEAAKQAVRTTVEALDASSVVALRLYGHRLPSEPKDPSCSDTELVIPFGPLDRARFIAAVDAARPLGQTPLAHSLQLAAADFGDLGDELAAVILVSDGEESCGGDPAAVACAFAERGLELTVHTVGFDVDAAARAQLQAIAQCTGGEYRDATDAGELADSLRQLTQAGLLLDKERETVGQEIRGGNGFDSAVPIAPGTYHLDHHQRPNEYDYFSIDVTPGWVLRVTQVAYEVGVRIEGDTFRENTNPTAGVWVYAPDRRKVSGQDSYAAGSQAAAGATVLAGGGGRYYISVGQSTWSGWGIHKGSPITVELIDQTDAESGTDAGDTDREAVTITPGEHRAWLHPRSYGATDKDVFSFAAQPSATYGLRVRPDEQQHIVSLVVTDEDGVRVASSKAPNAGAAVRLEELRPPRAGRLFVAVGASSSSQRLGATSYTLELTSQGGAAAAPESAEEAVQTEGETTPEGEQRDPTSPLDVFPGGMLTCGAALIFALLLGLALVVGVVLVIRRRSSGPR